MADDKSGEIAETSGQELRALRSDFVKSADSKDTLLAGAKTLDQADPLSRFRKLFHLPKGVIYLDGNSLGMMPKAALKRINAVASDEWAEGLIRSWNRAGWMELPLKVGDRIAPLVGAKPGEIVVGDSTSVCLFRCLAAALRMQNGRRLILAEADNFPSDSYIAEGLARMFGDVDVCYVDLATPLSKQLTNDAAVFILSHVHYRTAEIRDMRAISEAARKAGVLTLWDLSHSAGAIPVELHAAGADFAVGCSYKYLNGGPGAPAFTWVAPKLLPRAEHPLTGWLGHKSPFAFSEEYVPDPTIKRFITGTPQVLNLSALDEAMKLWADVDQAALREKSMAMTDFFIAGVEAECAGHGLKLRSPRKAKKRGGHVSFSCPDGYPVMRALIDRGVIGDFRMPDIIRFGFAPLYLSFSEVAKAVTILKDVLDNRSWDKPAYKVRAAVT